MDINYYKKYIKYKTKYINLQYGGMPSSGDIVSVPITKYSCNQHILDKELCIPNENGTYNTLGECTTQCDHIWKQYYKKLYQDILTFIDSNITDTSAIINLKKQFNLLIDEINKIYSASSEKLIIKYNIRFIISIMSMLFDVSDVNGTINGENFNMNLAFNQKTFYYMEECYTDNLDLFYKEYENLYRTQKSRFFYQSNLVNISILLKCYNDQCILKLLTQDKLPFQANSAKIQKYYLQLNIAYDINKDHIYEVFQNNKIELLKLLLLAYEDFDYNKIKLFYLKYLNFYYNAFTKLRYLKFVVLENKEDSEDNYEKQYNKLLDIVTQSTATSNNCVVYLSAILASENKFIKFNTTRILVGYLGMRYNSDDFYDSIDNITHDLTTIHHQYTCKLYFTEDELKDIQDLLKNLYIFYKDDKTTLESILQFLHLYIYEQRPFCLTINNIINLYKTFSLKSMDLDDLLNKLIKNYIDITKPKEEILNKLIYYNTKFKDSLRLGVKGDHNYNLALVTKLEYIMKETSPSFEDLFIDSKESDKVYTHELYMDIKNILYPIISQISTSDPSANRYGIILSICDDEYPLSIIKYILTTYNINRNKDDFVNLLRFLLDRYESQINAGGAHYLNNMKKLLSVTS